jgi:hypothetical protein
MGTASMNCCQNLGHELGHGKRNYPAEVQSAAYPHDELPRVVDFVEVSYVEWRIDPVLLHLVVVMNWKKMEWSPMSPLL